MSQLITSYEERNRRSEEKMQILLEFLKQETYTTIEILMGLFGYKTKETLYRLLKRGEKAGYLRREVLIAHGVKLTLWGITMHGIGQVLREGDRFIPKEFRLSRVALSTLDHQILNQQHRITLQKLGAREWQHGDRAAFINTVKLAHRPDSVFTAQTGVKFAIETERRVKAPARYRAIIGNHISAMSRAGDQPALWNMVIYVAPDAATRNAIKVIFDSIQEVIVRKNPLRLEEKHRARFLFFTSKELEGVNLNALVPER